MNDVKRHHIHLLETDVLRMGIFNFFKSTKKSTNVPEAFEGQLNNEQYAYVMKIAKQYHLEKGYTLLRTGEGEIIVEIDGEEQHRYLHNIVRILLMHDQDAWKELLYNHFDKSKNHNAAYTFFFKDFEYAEQYLRVLIKDKRMNTEGRLDHLVQRNDLPDTLTFLVFEFENQFKYLSYEDIHEWNRPVEELFDIAIQNIPLNEVHIEPYTINEIHHFYAFSSEGYSASCMLALENIAPDTVGTFGTLIAIPSGITAIAHPIENNTVMDLIEELIPDIQTFYREEPGQINTQFYWYYENQFRVFPEGKDDNGYYITLPDQLLRLFKEYIP